MQNDIFKKWIYFAEQDLNFAKSGLKDKCSLSIAEKIFNVMKEEISVER